MATWKDGAAYAPLERPDGFATPVADPLPSAEPYRSETPGPMRHPGGFDAAPQRQLAELGVVASQGRDPRESFAVASLALTAAPSHVTGRDPREPFTTAATPVVAPGPPPPTGAPLAPPPGAPWAPPVAAGSSQAQWAPPTPAQPQPNNVIAWICAVLCFAGLVISSGAPILLLLAGVLGFQAPAQHGWIARTTLVTGGALTVLQFSMGEFGEPGILPGLLGLLCSIGFVVSILRARPA